MILAMPMKSILELVPISLEEANAFVSQHHRHHDPVVGHKFSIAVSIGDRICGVIIVGRPVSRMLDNGTTPEVTRCCADSTTHVCSKLYRAAWRVCENLGYKRLITYTLPEGGGASLRGAGFKLIGESGGGSWSRKTRPRVDTHPMQSKLCWEMAV